MILENLSVGYPGRTLVEGVDAVFPAGSLTALVGRNGTGKSSLLRVMAGLVRPLAGKVTVKGNYEVITDRAPTVGRRPVEASCEGGNYELAALSPLELARIVGLVSTERIRLTNLRVCDVVALGRTPYTDWIGRMSPKDVAAVDSALERVAMSGFARKHMDTLSDGEAQRVMIARVLAQDTPVILLDEPTAFLDFVARRDICELLAELAHDGGKTVIFSSHELALVAEFADRALEIKKNTLQFFA